MPDDLAPEMQAAYLDGIIDISHHQDDEYVWSELRHKGLVAVIHKATQGGRFVDPEYAHRRRAIEGSGLLWGAYHFGVAGVDGAVQADHFLETVGDTRDTFLCLDFEHYKVRLDDGTRAERIMSVEDAERFIYRVLERTDRLPFFYSGHSIRSVLKKRRHELLAQCPLWAAGYVREEALQIQGSWERWTLWQYTDGTHPAGLPNKLGHVTDRSYFDGDSDMLRAAWAREALVS